LQAQGQWSSAPNDYGPQWDRLREAIRARDGYRCQVCGTGEQGRAHDVHHKTPLRSFHSSSGIPAFLAANRPENLITLCHTCHRRAETAVRVRSGLSGLAYALGHIAPLLLMCDTRDLGVHYDPQSPLADDTPTVVLYDRIPAGIGFSQRLFEQHVELLERTHQLVSTCGCEDGCPSCVGPGGENGAGGKPETIAILSALIPEKLESR
jgi:DEAD/DEAH box helicase domain-containing protein